MIEKVLVALGWGDGTLLQANLSSKRYEDVPPLLLFASFKAGCASEREHAVDAAVQELQLVLFLGSDRFGFGHQLAVHQGGVRVPTISADKPVDHELVGLSARH